MVYNNVYVSALAGKDPDSNQEPPKASIGRMTQSDHHGPKYVNRLESTSTELMR